MNFFKDKIQNWVCCFHKVFLIIKLWILSLALDFVLPECSVFRWSFSSVRLEDELLQTGQHNGPALWMDSNFPLVITSKCSWMWPIISDTLGNICAQTGHWSSCELPFCFVLCEDFSICKFSCFILNSFPFISDFFFTLVLSVSPSWSQSWWFSNSALKKNFWLHFEQEYLLAPSPCSTACCWRSDALVNNRQHTLHRNSDAGKVCSMRWHWSFAGEVKLKEQSLHSWILPSFLTWEATCCWMSSSESKDSWHLMQV